MGALVAVLQNDANLMRCQVRRLSAHVALSPPGQPPDACGYGYYTPGEVLLAKRPTGTAAALTLAQLVGDVDTEALLAHARHTPLGNHKDENTAPFRYRRWLFAHDGQVESFAQVRPALHALLPEFLRRAVHGDTGSEHAFALFLKYLRDDGHLDDLDVDAAVVGRALALTVRKLDDLCREAGAARPSTLNLVATNGRLLAATRRGRPLYYALLEGILPCALHELGAGGKETDPLLAPHRRAKAVCFATHLLLPNGFVEVPEGSVVSVSRSLAVSVSSLLH